VARPARAGRRRLGRLDRFDPANLDPAGPQELLPFESEHTAEAITERSVRTVEPTTDPRRRCRRA
jgi:hypothetical protein